MSLGQILLLTLAVAAAWFVLALAVGLIFGNAIDHADRTELGVEP